MDLLAIAAADPTVIPLWAAFLFAIGMYPVGMFFGCSTCCDPCSACTQGSLPETVTATLNGFTGHNKQWLGDLSFSACYGGGASGKIDGPGPETPDINPEGSRGPITTVSLTDGGSGYAKLGRTAPTLSASAYAHESGSGASFNVTVTKAPQPDECGIDYWEVTGITVASGGEGYIPSDFMLFDVAEGDSVEISATANITIGRIEPTITLAIDSPSGSGADISAVLEEAPGAPPLAKTWLIDSVTIEDGGDNYTHLDAVVITLAEGSEQGSSASLALVTDNAEPTLSASVISTGGDGASLSVTLTEGVSSPSGSAVWAVTSITVDTPGEAYSEGDYVPIGIVDGDARSGGCLAFVTEVDESGGIVAVTIYEGGEYFKGGPITSVQVDSGGEYWMLDGSIVAAELTNGGKYYREDASLPPYVADVAVTVSPQANGNGAQITATVGSDTEEVATFGKITALTIENTGDSYLAWRWLAFDCCDHALNGKTFVLKRNNLEWAPPGISVNFAGHDISVECIYSHRICGGWHWPFLAAFAGSRSVEQFSHRILVGFRGPSEPPVAAVLTRDALDWPESRQESACAASFYTQSIISDCDELAFEGAGQGGRTISVSAGGDYEAQDGFPGGSMSGCSACCQGYAVPPEEITVNVQDLRTNPTTSISGNYVLARISNQYWDFAIPGQPFALQVWISAFDCARHLDEGGCNNCIKKCGVFGGVTVSDFDGRRCPGEAEACDDFCIDTPICAPPPGIEIPINFLGKCFPPEFIITTT